MNALIEYIKHPECPDHNFELASYYESIRQYSAAASFYLRCAELTSHIHQRYESLLRLYLCITELGNREATCEHIIKQAISLCPEYSIGYFFMTQICERKGDWSSVYFYSCLGLKARQNPIFVSSFDYQYCYLWFQKAAASWWIGKADESRSIYRHILDKHKKNLDDKYTKLLETNLCSLGSGPSTESMHPYSKREKDKLIYQFPGLNKIENNFSQVYQDLFVLSILDGKSHGTYLEIGAAEPFYGSNTALLETVFNWSGVGIEYNKEKAELHSCRKNPVVCTDATNIDYDTFLSQYFKNTTIDYLQLDIEPSKNTYLALTKIPFNKYKFNVITYEHDHYIDITQTYRQKSRDYLESFGYVLVVNDVSPRENCSFEDWWVHRDLFSNKTCQILKNHTIKNVNLAPDILFKGKNNEGV